MLIGLIGGRGTGKKTIVEDLITNHSFKKLTINNNTNTQLTPNEIGFASAQELLDFCTSNWTHDFVTTDLDHVDTVLTFVKRPSFLLVRVSARLLDRWNRINSCQGSSLSLEDFIREDDEINYGKTRAGSEIPEETGGSKTLESLTRYTITNTSTIRDLKAKLLESDIGKIRELQRPSWDTYFTELANLASLRSNCMKRRVGAVLVSGDKRVLSTGYNGTPRGMINCNQGGCKRCNGSNFVPNILTQKSTVVDKCGVNLDECLCLHAEENALLEAGRERIKNSTLYCNTCPCLRCSIKIVQCGVLEVIYSNPYSMDKQAQKIFTEAGIKLRQFNSIL
ncbi:hypothetical protein MJO29_000491 [Puccinia striiformis f. sp. tritici]|uniref:Deoxycytidylate deaminase n=1 Tax=Puccinia striiformis f. sp. tritici PST-78 TaxID=1165861 RepID=A0A0L0UT90_9BASI|nr:hypothetical protein Pst134EB_001676 [Puccinia striiformis f. sp. tritici]KAI7967214.1 hypothetical protein MJO29_000491 [Puccinia striiformis f. sp. tritici]KNE90277.1 hypothetical protein PSTG_16270 [Puccinia striiformis f. sp. tritici PST-78]